ncbi:peroxide stress protein YaaA [Anaerosporobacter faecicola]|uniref:peroxide stress protein YaaA n=1 Tax=Anaerosporobacter faecicola TaxID=2718714 RepID=UPI00143B5925|nr:peroxide stress protein YaaA [Anaerosporobacter faecicola]
MRIIISPAKKMNNRADECGIQELPVYIRETELIMKWLKQLSFDEAKSLWACNDQLAELNYTRFQNMDLYKNLTPALLAYEGLQYQHMAPGVFSEEAIHYVEKNLRILSGFYGVLKPFDGVTPYRLEMQAKANIGESKGLYQFWSDKLYHEVFDEDRVVINLASKEYSTCIERHLSVEDHFITCVFGEMKGEKIVQKSTLAKMARGEMVRFMAENNVKSPEEIKEFHELSLVFQPELSTDQQYVYLIKK